MKMPRHQCRSAGFTLVELAIAVAITGLALVSLVALQTRVVGNYARENNLTRAVLYAQYLMTFVEVDARDKEVEQSSGNLVDLLTKRDYFSDLDHSEAERELIADWEYSLEVEKEDFGLGALIAEYLGNGKQVDIARRIRLIVKFGAGLADRYIITYFVNAPQK